MRQEESNQNKQLESLNWQGIIINTIIITTITWKQTKPSTFTRSKQTHTKTIDARRKRILNVLN